jgi:uncharacterized small protein (DUF1192 family)
MEAAAQRIEAEQPTVVTAREEAVQAVAEALFARGQVACEFHGGTIYDECSSCCGLVDELHRDALVAVAAVWPIIAEQEQATEIERLRAARIQSKAVHLAAMADRDEARAMHSFALDQRDAVEARLAAVRALHTPTSDGGGWCSECRTGDEHNVYLPYPCATVRALDGAS